jgi:hypothetical protein
MQHDLFEGEVVRFKVGIIWREEGFANGVGRQIPDGSGVCRPTGGRDRHARGGGQKAMAMPARSPSKRRNWLP